MITLVTEVPLPIFITCISILTLYIMVSSIKKYLHKNKYMFFLGVSLVFTGLWCIVARCLHDFLDLSSTIRGIIIGISVIIIILLFFSIVLVIRDKVRNGNLGSEERSRLKIAAVFLSLGALAYLVIFIIMKLQIVN